MTVAPLTGWVMSDTVLFTPSAWFYDGTFFPHSMAWLLTTLKLTL